MKNLKLVLLKKPHIYHDNIEVPLEVKEDKFSYLIVKSPLTDVEFEIDYNEYVNRFLSTSYSEKDTTNVKNYYKGKNSLYKFAEEWQLNPYEFDIIKRIIRCRHKGQFKEDLEKTKDLIDLYLKEYNNGD